MYKIKAANGTNNICGNNVKKYRTSFDPPLSQRHMAIKLQSMGYDVDHHFIRRIENGERFVTDIEIKLLCEFFRITPNDLLDSKSKTPNIPD